LINSLEFFNELLVDILDDSELISSLKLSFLTKEWAAGNDIIYPVKFIDELKITLIKEYEQGAINMAISDVKKAEFYQSSGIMIDSILEQYFPLSNENNIPEDYDSWFVGGQKMVHSKDAFSEEPEAHYMDFDTFLATVVTNEIREGITSTFRMNKTKSYLFKSEEIFNAISELGIDKNYVIVTFGINLKHYQEFLKIKGLSEGVFKGVNILSFNGSRSIRESIYVLKQNDLPLILTQEIDDEIKDKFSLEKISKTNNIYGSVLDCNLVSEEISLELSAKHTEEELKKSVLLSIVQSTEIRWNKNIEMIELIEYSEYRQDGLPNKLSDVVKLEKGE
jgi:hypothetical protein